MAGTMHVGKAGQLAVMAEFLLRGYNVAMPEVDLGDDIFVVSNHDGQLWRVQVKTAVAKPTRTGYQGKFAVSLAQLNTTRIPDLYFVFAFRQSSAWVFLTLPRSRLFEETTVHEAGSISRGQVLYTILTSQRGTSCSGRDWSSSQGDWGEWPLIE